MSGGGGVPMCCLLSTATWTRLPSPRPPKFLLPSGKRSGYATGGGRNARGSRPNQFCECAIVGLRTTLNTVMCELTGLDYVRSSISDGDYSSLNPCLDVQRTEQLTQWYNQLSSAQVLSWNISNQLYIVRIDWSSRKWRTVTMAYHMNDGLHWRRMFLNIVVAATSETLPDKSVDGHKTCKNYSPKVWNNRFNRTHCSKWSAAFVLFSFYQVEWRHR